MFFWPIQLPWFIALHAGGLALLGGALLFSTPKQSGQDRSVLGITTIALGLSYLCTACMPLDQNQFLHASVPVRVVLATLAGTRWITTRARDRALYSDAGPLFFIALYDGLGGAALGWYLGSFSGRAPAFRS